MLPLNNIVMQWFTEKRTGARGTERIKQASHLQRLIFHFQPNLQSTRNHAGRMQKRERKASQGVKSKISAKEKRDRKKYKRLHWRKARKEGKATAPPWLWPVNNTACSRDISFVLCLNGKWLVGIQSGRLSLGHVSKGASMWKHMPTSLPCHEHQSPPSD